MATVAVVIGHHPDAPGAVMDVGDESVSEYEFWKPFARELVLTIRQRGVEAVVVERPNHDPDQALADRVSGTGADLAIELHFNSASRTAWGTEMIHYPGSVDGNRLARTLQENVTSALGTKDRGLLQRRWPFVELTTMPAVICEPFFGSNESDAARGLTRLPDLMQAYRSALVDAAGEVSV